MGLFFHLFSFHQKGETLPGQVRSGSLLSSSPETPQGHGPYLTGRGLHQTLCLAQSGCQESGTQEGHKHKRFLSPDNLFSQTKVSDSCLNPERKAWAEIIAMQKQDFLGPTRNSLPRFLKESFFPVLPGMPTLPISPDVIWTVFLFGSA